MIRKQHQGGPNMVAWVVLEIPKTFAKTLCIYQVCTCIYFSCTSFSCHSLIKKCSLLASYQLPPHFTKDFSGPSKLLFANQSTRIFLSPSIAICEHRCSCICCPLPTPNPSYLSYDNPHKNQRLITSHIDMHMDTNMTTWHEASARLFWFGNSQFENPGFTTNQYYVSQTLRMSFCTENCHGKDRRERKEQKLR